MHTCRCPCIPTHACAHTCSLAHRVIHSLNHYQLNALTVPLLTHSFAPSSVPLHEFCPVTFMLINDVWLCSAPALQHRSLATARCLQTSHTKVVSSAEMAPDILVCTSASCSLGKKNKAKGMLLGAINPSFPLASLEPIQKGWGRGRGCPR